MPQKSSFLFVPRGCLWLCSCYSAQLCGALTMIWWIYGFVSISCLHCSFSDGSGCQKTGIWFLSQLSRNVSDNWYYSGLERCCGDLEQNKNIASLGYLEEKKVILHMFMVWSLWIHFTNELIDLNPLPPGPGSFNTQVQVVSDIRWG